MPSVTLRLEFKGATWSTQLATAKTFELDHVGLPISSDAIASLRSGQKRHGVAQTPDAARIALRLLALLWGGLAREEAEQVLGISVARQHEITGQFTSLTKQRRSAGHRRHRVWLESRARLMWNSAESQKPVKSCSNRQSINGL